MQEKCFADKTNFEQKCFAYKTYCILHYAKRPFFCKILYFDSSKADTNIKEDIEDVKQLVTACDFCSSKANTKITCGQKPPLLVHNGDAQIQKTTHKQTAP